jgi:methylenetetrahydrofolate reductase (NADPH)
LIRQVFALTVPDDLIRTLAEAAPAQKSAHHVSAHFFSFGGLGATARWTRAVADGRIVLEANGGFGVLGPE